MGVSGWMGASNQWEYPISGSIQLPAPRPQPRAGSSRQPGTCHCHAPPRLMQIDRSDLDWAADQGLLSDQQADRLWTALQRRTSSGQPSSTSSEGIPSNGSSSEGKPSNGSSSNGSFSGGSQVAWQDPATIAYYAGALIVIVAMGWFALRVSEGYGPLVLGGIAAGYGAVFGSAGLYVRLWKNMPVAGGLLVAVAVAMVPVAAYGIEKGAGLWPALLGPGSLADRIQESWALEDALTLAAGAVAASRVRFSFLAVPPLVAGWHLAAGSGPELLNPEITASAQQWISVVYGTCAVGLARQVGRPGGQDYAFWGHLIGLLALWGGLTLMEKSEAGYAGYLLLSVGLALGTAVFRRQAFLVFGALGILTYLVHLAEEVFQGSVYFPIALSGIGVAVIYLGAKYRANRERLLRAIRSRMPRALQRLAPPRQE
jgi:hypothetical protein